MAMISVFSVNGQVILATTAQMPSDMAVMNLATLPRTVLTKFLHQEHHATIENLIQGINAPTTGGTDHSSIIVPDIGDITTDDSYTPVYTVTEAAALEDMPHALLPATTAAPATLQLMDAPITSHTMIPTGIVTPDPTLTISPTVANHATPWTGAGLTLPTHVLPHKILSPGRLSNAQDPQFLINPTSLKLSPSRILLQTLHQILTVTHLLNYYGLR